MKWFFANIIAVVLVSSILPGTATVAFADTFVLDFETSFDGWQQQWHKDSPPPGSDGIVSHSTERGYLNGASLKFDMGDGFGDDGTLWIEMPFDVSNVLPTRIAVEFQLFNSFEGLPNFEVKAAIRTDSPDEQADFTTIGVTDTAEGWVPFVIEETITNPAGQAWVALGVRVAWESHRDYWIDHVVVSTTVIPEPSSAILLAIALASIGVLAMGRHARRIGSEQTDSRRSQQWRSIFSLTAFSLFYLLLAVLSSALV